MAECCTQSQGKPQKPRRHICPENGKACLDVPYKTILHHVKEPWQLALFEQGYYFCEDPDCDVVYFGDDNSTIKKTSIRTKIGIKDNSEDALVCYCFGVSKSVAKFDKSTRNYVIEQTRRSLCSCSTSNPSGRCCLKDFPKQ